MLDEQSFKMLWIRENEEKVLPFGYMSTFFCIESERTQKGFPDVLEVMYKDNTLCATNQCQMYEFKISKTKDNRIKFERNQPIFYRSNPYINVIVVALKYSDGNKVNSKDIVTFNVKELFDKKSQHPLTGESGLEVQL